MFSGFREAVLSVKDIDIWQAFFQEAAGWETVYEGDVPASVLSHWNVTEGTGREVVMVNKGEDTGYVRLMSFYGVARQIIRPHDQPWDTGGIFDLNLRVANMDEAEKSIERFGWQANAAPADFSFGPFKVKEWLVRGPDGIRFALIERLEPPLEGWPHLKKMSRVFNSTQIVKDIDQSLDFYRDKLGMEIYLESKGASEEAGPNTLTLPHNLVTEISRSVYILHPEGLNEGSVEIIEFDGATGEDFSERAVPPNRGIATLRFPVSDWPGFLTHLENENIPIVAGPTRTTLAPYGEVDILAIRAPEGAWLEFFIDAE